MTLVHVDLRRPDVTTDEPSEGMIELAPYRRVTVTEGDDTYIRLPEPFRVRLVEGQADVDLAPTGADWCWIAVERVAKGERRYVVVPDSATEIDYADLVDVDPATLEPTAQPEAAWTIELAEANTKVTAAEAAALEASTSSVTALEAAVEASSAAAAATSAVLDLGTEVEGKADAAAVTTALASKADVAALAAKADQTAVDTALAAKANAADVTTALASKASTAALAALDASVEERVEDAVEAHTPGMELGYVERTSNFTTTATTAGAGSIIPTFSVTVVGQGRPVDFECYLPQVFHSVANTAVLCYLTITTGGVAANVPYTSISSARTDAGEAVILRRRRILTAGVSYTATVNVYGLAAGTTTVAGATSTYPFLSAVSR